MNPANASRINHVIDRISSFRFPPEALLLALAIMLPALPHAVGESTNESVAEDSDEEFIALSPFVVSASDDQGYTASQTLAGTRLRTDLKDIGASISTVSAQFLQDTRPAIPQVPVTIVKRAEALVIQFALASTADKADVRNAELTAAMEAISKATQATTGLRFEPREVYLASADRIKSVMRKNGTITSFAHFVIFADFSEGLRPYQRVKQVRDLLTGLKLASATTKLVDGPVGLYIRRPSQFRGEILTKIFADLETVKKGLGTECEVQVNGLNGAMKMRTCSETDIELWIDYSFSIQSIRELEAKKLAKR